MFLSSTLKDMKHVLQPRIICNLDLIKGDLTSKNNENERDKKIKETSKKINQCC